jgi:integrase
MKQEKVNVKVVPDIRRMKGESRFPLKLRITCKGTRKYYGTGYDASREEWDHINSAEAKGDLRKIKVEIAGIEKNAQTCIDRITPFSFKQFEKEFFEQRIRYESLKSAFDVYIEDLKANEQWGTAASYQTACNALHKFKPKIALEDIDKEFLQKFEKSILDAGKSITTVGIYLRPLRAIINIAKDNGAFRAEAYPFGKRKYVIPTGKNVKKALAIDQIRDIFNYKTVPGTSMEMAKDFWIFTYLCNGINMMDIAHLRIKDVDSRSIRFIREKTKRTTKGDPIIITAARNSFINEILSKWGKTFGLPEEYVFAIIDIEDTVEMARKKIQQFTKQVNKWMRRVGVELGFNLNLTTYVARHSFATILLRNGAPMTFASQSLGHSSLITTQKYFAGFDLDNHQEFTKALVAFN